MTLQGVHSFSLTLHVPSCWNLFQPQVKAAPLSVRTAQCLAPLQTCHHISLCQYPLLMASSPSFWVAGLKRICSAFPEARPIYTNSASTWTCDIF